MIELVEGEDLSEVLAGLGNGAPPAGGHFIKTQARRLPLEDALAIARQIADALEAAHDQGIIHRDLKPANVKVRPDGTVKVLDFVAPGQGDGAHGRDVGKRLDVADDYHAGDGAGRDNDGSRIAFGSDRDGRFSRTRNRQTVPPPKRCCSSPPRENAVPYSWSPDGQFILHRYMNLGSFNTGVLPVSGDPKPHLYQAVNYQLANSVVSPDGRLMACNSNESGRYDVFLQTFPVPGGKWQVWKDGGVHPKRRDDGKELFYYAQDGNLVTVPIGGGSTPQLGAALPLFKPRLPNGPTVTTGFLAQYDVTPDGQRLPAERAG